MGILCRLFEKELLQRALEYSYHLLPVSLLILIPITPVLPVWSFMPDLELQSLHHSLVIILGHLRHLLISHDIPVIRCLQRHSRSFRRWRLSCLQGRESDLPEVRGDLSLLPVSVGVVSTIGYSY